MDCYNVNINKNNFRKTSIKNIIDSNDTKKLYRQRNKEKISKKNKQYREQNKEKFKEYNKEYYENNKEKIKEYQKKYQKEYRERKKIININKKEKNASKSTT